jgi:HPt (histidine-containing phosphotransfer) domain-containing protein
MTEPNDSKEDARQRAIRAALEELRAEYAEALPGVLAELTTGAEVARESGSDADYRALRTLAHRMHGAAGSYGFKAVSRAACALEEMLTAAEEAGMTGGPALAKPVEAAVTDIVETVKRELADYAASQPRA